MNPAPSTFELVLMIVAVVLGTVVGAYLAYVMLYFMMLPWFIMIHIFSLGSILIPDFGNPLELFRKKKK